VRKKYDSAKKHSVTVMGPSKESYISPEKKTEEEYEEKKEKLSHSIKKLQKAICKKDILEKQRLEDLNTEKDDIKSQLIGLNHYKEQLEKKLESQQFIQKNLETKIFELEKEVEKQTALVQELKHNESLFMKREEEYKDSQVQLKTKLLEKKKKIREFKSAYFNAKLIFPRDNMALIKEEEEGLKEKASSTLEELEKKNEQLQNDL